MRTQRTRRRIALGFARTAAGVCAVALGISTWGLTLSGIPHASAAANAGSLEVVKPFDGTSEAGQPLSGGASATPFSFLLPAGAACAGDSANDGYRVQSYMVPAAVDVGSLTFDSAGPVPTTIGSGFRQPLYTSTFSPYVNAQTANAFPAPGPGPVVNIPAFSLGLWEPGNVPAGAYDVGIACTLGPPSATQLDQYWNVQIEVVADAADEPAGLTWTVVEGSTTTTTSPSSTTSSSTTTTMPTDGATTTTSATVTTTTLATVTGAAVAGTQVLPTGGQPTADTFAQSLATLPATGGSLLSPVAWAVLLIIFGRIAVLLGRPPRLLPARTQ